MPLDLHVLGLSLAFILSQDQTLRCISCCYFFFPSKSAPAEIDFLLYFACTTLASFQSFNDLASRFQDLFRSPSLEKRCKGTPFFPFLPNFLSTFLCYTTYFFLNTLIDTPLFPYFFLLKIERKFRKHNLNTTTGYHGRLFACDTRLFYVQGRLNFMAGKAKCFGHSRINNFSVDDIQAFI